MSKDPQRTEFAQQAVDFNDRFSYKFARQVYGKLRARRLRLSQPDGPSTAGGRQARLPVVLVPDKGDGNMVLGWIDPNLRQAEIRSYEALRKQFAARFSVSLDLEPEAYEQLKHDLESFLRIQKFDVRRAVETERREDGGDVRHTPFGLMISILVAGVLIGLGLGYVLFKS